MFNHHNGAVPTQESRKYLEGHQKRVYCYTADQLDYQMQRMGSLTMAVGHLKLVSEITWESENLVFAVLHLGGWEIRRTDPPLEFSDFVKNQIT